MSKKANAQLLGPPDWTLVTITLVLCALGLMMVYSASSDLGYRDFDDPAYFLKRQLIWLGIGLLGMFIAARLPYQLWR